MKLEITKHSHSAGESNFHYQFTPAYRRRVFADERVRKLVRAYLYAKAAELHVAIVTEEFGPDHLHVFVANCKNYSVPRLAQEFKGFISRMMRKNHRKLFSRLLWGDSFWTGGYFYRSIGQASSEAVRFYIEHSQKKHWEVVDYEYYLYSNQTKITQF